LPLSLLSKAAPYLEEPEAFAQLENPLELFGKRNTTVVTREQLEALLQHVKAVITALGEEIHRGNIAVRPCRMRQTLSCQYCGYQAICQIQTVDLARASEELVPLERDEVWRRLEQERGGSANANMDDRTTAGH